jgi:hypothetical protein
MGGASTSIRRGNHTHHATIILVVHYILYYNRVLSSIGGLDSAVSGTDGGWRNVIARVSPAAITRVRHSSYRKQTRFGEVSLEWSYEQPAGSGFVMQLSVPVGVTVAAHAPLTLPGGTLATLYEATEAKPALLWSADGSAESDMKTAGVGSISLAGDAVVVRVSSGKYQFQGRYE